MTMFGGDCGRECTPVSCVFLWIYPSSHLYSALTFLQGLLPAAKGENGVPSPAANKPHLRINHLNSTERKVGLRACFIYLVSFVTHLSG